MSQSRGVSTAVSLNTSICAAGACTRCSVSVEEIVEPDEQRGAPPLFHSKYILLPADETEDSPHAGNSFCSATVSRMMSPGDNGHDRSSISPRLDEANLPGPPDFSHTLRQCASVLGKRPAPTEPPAAVAQSPEPAVVQLLPPSAKALGKRRRIEPDVIASPAEVGRSVTGVFGGAQSPTFPRGDIRLPSVPQRPMFNVHNARPSGSGSTPDMEFASRGYGYL
ncbi:hypothetical protein K438DRAFT_1964934 [Mycena galopus ATCC 62051]|nr:hypothetical protein K438DRAFT_1964934 [Mycena galopus ATCC 62051]